MKRFFFMFLILVAHLNCLAQETLKTVVAKEGDGIFSMLRKEGLDPSKYYQEFLQLNEINIVNGSELKLGKTYKIPNASDSFIAKGRLVNVTDASEEAIYDQELANMSLKSNKLNDAVYYLIAEGEYQKNGFCETIVSNLAYDFLLNGAQVYVIKADSIANSKGEDYRFQEYVDIVNKRYLRHNGKYQRLLIVRTGNEVKGQRVNVAVHHYDKSSEGEKFAQNIEEVLAKDARTKRNKNNPKNIFAEGNDLFLAKNALPTVSVLDISVANGKVKNEEFSIDTDKKNFANLLKKAMLNDFAELDIEE